MTFTVAGGRYQARFGATLQQFYYLQGGPAAGRSGSLPDTVPIALTGYEGGSYVATTGRNPAGQHIYRWEPQP